MPLHRRLRRFGDRPTEPPHANTDQYRHRNTHAQHYHSTTDTKEDASPISCERGESEMSREKECLPNCQLDSTSSSEAETVSDGSGLIESESDNDESPSKPTGFSALRSSPRVRTVTSVIRLPETKGQTSKVEVMRVAQSTLSPAQPDCASQVQLVGLRSWVAKVNRAPA